MNLEDLMQINVPTIVCDKCADTITKAIHNVDPDAQVKVDIEAKQVDVETSATETSLREAITTVGHEPA